MGVLGAMFPAFFESDFESECDSESECESCSGDMKVWHVQTVRCVRCLACLAVSLARPRSQGQLCETERNKQQ